MTALGSVLVATTVAAERAHTAEVPPGLKPGDTVVFYGDSITHHNHYVDYVSLFYYTRYPGTRLHFYNAGVGGNRTSSALVRFRQDVADQRPALVIVLLGMNDGRYRAFNDKALAAYQKGMTTILRRISKETHAKAILLTPSFYDHQVRLQHLPPGRTAYAGYNQTLVRFGAYLRDLGKNEGIPVIDLNAPMKRMTETLRQADPKATLSRDGVHPLATGHFVMAHAILKGLDVTPLVSSVRIDAGRGQVETERAAVQDLAVTHTGVTFALTQASLPYPCPEAARSMLALVPFTHDLNQERLQIKGLKPGTYALAIDSRSVGTFAQQDLAQGVNLSENKDTPQYKQALEVLALHEKLQALVKKQRAFRWMEKVRGYCKPDGTYPSNRQGSVIIDDKDEVVEVSKEEWQKHFDTLAQEAPAVEKQIAALEDAIYKANQPKRHTYRFTRE